MTRMRCATIVTLAFLVGAPASAQHASALDASVAARGQGAPLAERAGAGRGAPATEKDVLAFEREVEAAVVRGDVAFLDRACTDDFTFTHGDGWTVGKPPLRVDNKAQWLASVAKKPYLSRDLNSVQVELHGDIAITYGRYRATNRSAAPGRSAFTVWFERVYVRRDGRWQYVSHRTVNGPNYEP